MTERASDLFKTCSVDGRVGLKVLTESVGGATEIKMAWETPWSPRVGGDGG